MGIASGASWFTLAQGSPLHRAGLRPQAQSRPVLLADATDQLHQVLGLLPRRRVHWLISVVESDVVEPDDDGSGFDPIPKRWVIERTFGWFGGYHRLIQDYERLPEMSKAMVRAAMIRLMVPESPDPPNSF